MWKFLDNVFSGFAGGQVGTRAQVLQEYVFLLGVVCHAESLGRLHCGFSSQLAWPDTNAFLQQNREA
jgi:hypothetical protein